MTILSILSDTVIMYRNSLDKEELITNSVDKKYSGKKGSKKRFQDLSNQRRFTNEMLDTITSNLPL